MNNEVKESLDRIKGLENELGMLHSERSNPGYVARTRDDLVERLRKANQQLSEFNKRQEQLPELIAMYGQLIVKAKEDHSRIIEESSKAKEAQRVAQRALELIQGLDLNEEQLKELRASL